MNHSNGNRKFAHLFLLFLVLVGSILRFQGIEKKSFWADELFTLRMALYYPVLPENGGAWYRKTSIFEIRDGDTFLTAKAAEQHPPLQDFLEKISVNALGLSELSARLPGALAACALLAWFAWFAARSTDPWKRRALTWALLLLAFSPALVIYAQDARAYSLGASLVGMGGLLWLLRWEQGWHHVQPPGWGEIALFVLACYSHYNAAALVAVLLLPDFWVACKTRNTTTLLRLSCLTFAFLIWVGFSASTIVATTQGSVAWGKFSSLQNALFTMSGAVTIAHTPWFWLFAVSILVVFARHFFTRPQQALPQWMVKTFFMLLLLVAYLVLAGMIVAKAGMAHPRYYIFAVPLFAVLAGVLLAQVHRTGWAVVTAILITIVAIPATHSKQLQNLEDFRSIAHAALKDSDQDTLFLFPWTPNRDLYRVYLDKLSGQDNRSRMVGISHSSEVPQICERLQRAKHIAILAHDSGKPIIAEVYAACGSHWPKRQQTQFHNTFTEHWRAEQVRPLVQP